MKFQLGLANPRWNFNPGWKFKVFHIIDIFCNPGWKFDTTHTWIPCLFLKNKDGNFTRTFEMDRWQTYQSYKMFSRIGQFICKILILEYWLFSMVAMIWSNNSDITLTCWRIKIILSFCCSHLCFDLFLTGLWFSLLTFIKFSIESRLLYFNPGWIFLYNCNIFQLSIPSSNFNPSWKSPYIQPLNTILVLNKPGFWVYLS